VIPVVGIEEMAVKRDIAEEHRENIRRAELHRRAWSQRMAVKEYFTEHGGWEDKLHLLAAIVHEPLEPRSRTHIRVQQGRSP
jgi:hypothetical protein